MWNQIEEVWIKSWFFVLDFSIIHNKPTFRFSGNFDPMRLEQDTMSHTSDDAPVLPGQQWNLDSYRVYDKVCFLTVRHKWVPYSYGLTFHFLMDTEPSGSSVKVSK